MFWIASNEGLILNGSSAHAGLRSRLLGWDDYEDDERQGFLRISADDIDEMGTAGIVSAILERIGTDTPTYLSLDIDVLDPGLVSEAQFSPLEVTFMTDHQQCPGTGTPEAGGWTSREVIRILRGLEPLNVVGADSELSFLSKFFLICFILWVARRILGVEEVPGSVSLLQFDSERDILTPKLFSSRGGPRL